MKSCACPALAALLVTLSCHAGERVVLYGDDSYPPYAYLENGQFKGIYVELLQAAASRMTGRYQLELVPTPWRRGLSMLESGEAFGLFPPYRREERTFIDAYSIALYRERVVVVCNDRTMSKPRQRFPRDFGDVTIGINAGFALSGVLVTARRNHTVRIDEANGNAVNLRKLALNRIGCYANDSLSIRYTVKRMKDDTAHFPELDALTLHEVTELSGEEAYVGFSRRASPAFKADFIKRLDATLLTLQQEGEVDRILARYGF
ncbi:substrate-binding periplasmic protein [Pseudogulbenkiania subflava]|uniref:Polar amino acid transport system substrate-binding protein n=1 Tax=Pseudogulbenkiania subflava DSM 22618 TaxID=1123014 RepID=A0A1Y6CAZ4_9NEIS|nr:transporter substrate-binding domain-containing protein [Pseudogulbenkiania subflava]SMF45803.1 polar amino acid transport system substrate-binding protein [Pseudogulbenkiania subflava DSM 22618]